MSVSVTLVFDLDGTLAETAGDLIAALNFAVAPEGIAAVPVEAARSLVGAGGRALIQRSFQRAGRTLTAGKLETLFGDFLAYYNAHIANETRLFPGVEATLDRAAGRGWRLAVCTNKLELSAHLLLEKLGVAQKFGFICGQDTFGAAKPDPRPLLETIRAVGGRPQAAVMVGDSLTDVRVARAAAMKVILVDFGYTDVPAVELGADRVISHFDALFEAVDALGLP